MIEAISDGSQWDFPFGYVSGPSTVAGSSWPRRTLGSVAINHDETTDATPTPPGIKSGTATSHRRVG